jgi:hypothetical protein
VRGETAAEEIAIAKLAAASDDAAGGGDVASLTFSAFFTPDRMVISR